MSSNLGEQLTVIGINFGNSYASIAVITKEGKAECIANEDGERQIAAAISFHGEEMYVGNQAMPQLVKNADNTIIGFRNVLGKKFTEIQSSTLDSPLTPSARIVQHPSQPDIPCYAVQVLVPSPAPLATSRGTSTPSSTLPPSSRPSTQHPTPLATPRSEPTSQTRYITPHDAATLFLKSLHQSAIDFLGRVPDGAVISVPAWFGEAQRDAVQSAASEAGIKVLQLLEEDAAAASVILDADNEMNVGKDADRTALLVDWGVSDLVVSLLSVRAGLAHVLASKRAPELGTGSPGSIDEVLVKHFAKEFVKKTGEALQVCPASGASARAQTKLALALPHVKRSLASASSSNSTQISIESLQGGLDFSAVLNRMRAAGLLSGAFMRFVEVVRGMLETAGGEGEGWAGRGLWVDTIVWVGGGGCLGTAGAGSELLASGVLSEGVRDESVGAPEEVVARGCALHARLTLDDGALGADVREVPATRRTIGVIVPSTAVANGDAEHGGTDLGGQWIPVLPAETPLPARRTVRFPVASSSTARAVFEVWEVVEMVRVRRTVQAQLSDASDEEEEEIEEREREVSKEQYLGVLDVPLSGGRPMVEIQFDMDVQGVLDVRARQADKDWVNM